MDKIEQLYNLYLEKGLLSDNTSLDSFRNANKDQINKLYDLGKNNGLFESTDSEKFSSAWDLKKKENTTSFSEENTQSVSEEPKQVGSLESKEGSSIKIVPLTDEEVADGERIKNSGQEGLLEVSNQLQESTTEQKIQDINPLLEEYKSRTSISSQEEEEIRDSISADDKKEGLWNTVKDGAKYVWNNILTAPSRAFGGDSLKVERDNLKESRDQARKILEENNEEITNQSLKELTYKLELDKRKKNLTDSKTEEFIESLEEEDRIEDKEKLQSEFSIRFSKNFKKSVNKRIEITTLNQQLPKLENELLSLNEKAIQGTATEEDRVLFNEISKEYRRKAVQLNKSVLDFNKIDEEISETENEIDLFKRNYSDVDNFLGRVSLGIVDILVNTGYLLNEVSKFNNENGGIFIPNIPIEYNHQIDNFLKNQKIEIENQRSVLKRPKSVSDINNVYDLVEWGANTIADQTGNTALMIATGGAGIVTLGASEAGNKAYELNIEEDQTGKKIDPFKKWFSVIGSGTITALSEKITLGQLNKGIRAFKSVPVPTLKRNAGQYFKDNYKPYLKDVAEETFSELSETIGNNFVDKYILDKDISMLEGVDADLVASSVFMSNVFKIGALRKDVLKAFTKKDVNQIIGENNQKILELSNSLNLEGLGDFERNNIQRLIDKKLEQNNSILEREHKKLDNLNSSQKQRLVQIENEIYGYRARYRKVSNSDMPQKQKDEILKDIEADVEIFLSEKEGILNKGNNFNLGTNDFIDSFDNVEDISDIDAGTAQININGAKVSVKSENGKINLKSISVNPNERGQGKAKKALQEVTKIADEKGVEIELEVNPLDETTDKNQLEKFYSDNGFVKTDGDKMIRKPKEDNSFEGIDKSLSNENTEFNPLESEGESISRLSAQVSDSKTIEQVAKEHTESYLDYLNEQESGEDVMQSEFVRTFEKRLIDALKNPKKFDANQQRNFKNGSRINEEGNVISEKEYLEGKGNLSVKEQIENTTDKEVSKKEENTSIEIETNTNNYTVSVIDGDIDIKPKFGKKSKVIISPSERRTIIKKYKEKTDFSKGQVANFENRQDANDTQIAEIVAEESNNPLEIATTLNNLQNSSSENKIEVSKEDAIADALSRNALTENSKSEVTDLGKSYTNIGFRKNKERKSIDQIREVAEDIFGREVSYQDVLDFLNSYEKISDYRKSKPETNSLELDLKARFKKLTGLNLNNKTLKEILDKYNSPKKENTNDSNEVPFQTESLQTSIGGEQLTGLVDRLQETGLADNVQILTDRQIKNTLKSINTGNPRLSSQKPIETPFGFVYDGVVYLNRDKVKKDTPIHEFGHLWNSYIKKNNPDVYNRGLQLIEEDGTYLKQVENNPAYENLTPEQKKEEALAQAIGEKGVKILKESKKKKFATWFRTAFSKIARGLGLRNMSGDKLSKLNLDAFTTLASAELLSGKEIKSRPKQRTVRNKQKQVNQIDVIVASENARLKERRRIIDKIKSEKTITNAVRKEVVKYINDKLNSKNSKKANKREIKNLLNIVRKTKTKKTMLNAFNKVDDIFLGLENKIIYDNILNIIERKLSKKQSGRVKANLVTEDVERILNTVKKYISKKQETVSPVKSNNKKISQLSDAFDKRQELLEKKNKTEQDYFDIEGLSIAIDVLTGLGSKDKKTENKLLSESFENISSIYNDGRSKLIELRNTTKENLDKAIKEYVQDANPKGKTTIKTVDDLDKENKSLKNSFSRFLFTIGSGNFTGNLDSIMTIISKKGGENRDSSPLVQFVNRLKNRETFKKRRIAMFSNLVTENQKRIFGTVKKADILLNEKQNITVFRKNDNSDKNTPKNQETISFTNSELLNLWMNYKNEKLRAGLENNGFDSEFFDNLNLPEKVKEYGESLFEVYDELHIESDETYKKMNFHSMGKEPFYAGKVYRVNESIEKDNDLKLDQSSFNIGTTGFGSQKERTNNDKPIQAVDVNTLILRAISETSHYIAYAEMHREMNAMLDSKDFNKAVRLNNGKNGDLIMNMLKFYKKNDLEKGGYKGVALLDFFGRNITRATLALKTKVGITQTISFFNGAIDMPVKTEKSFLHYYNPIKLVETMSFLLKESDYLKNRYDVDGIENTVTGLSEIANKSNFSLENNTAEANRKAFSRFMNNVLSKSLVNVKYGDMFGLSGAVPAYLAWKDKYIARGLSEEVAHQKALKKFEASVDRSQQTTSTFGKSPFQKNPFGRYLAMFATSPIQNMQNANYHWRELMRGLSKDKQAKGTNLKNIMGILNYQFAQPMLYTYIANLMVGSMLPALGFGEEEPDDLDKSLLNSAILSNYGSVPFVGGMLLLGLDKATGKDFTFGSLVNSPLLSFMQDINDDLEKWLGAKTKKSQVKYRTRTLKKLSSILMSVPSMFTDTVLDFEDIYWNDEVDSTVKILKAFGWSDYTIDKAREERKTREQAKSEKEKAEKQWVKSEKKYEKDKKVNKIRDTFKKGGNKR